MIAREPKSCRRRDAATLVAGVCAAGIRAPMDFASFHDHDRLPWRFHPLLNASDDALIRL